MWPPIEITKVVAEEGPGSNNGWSIGYRPENKHEYKTPNTEIHHIYMQCTVYIYIHIVSYSHIEYVVKSSVDMLKYLEM